MIASAPAVAPSSDVRRNSRSTPNAYPRLNAEDVPVAVEKPAVATIGWLNYGDPENEDWGSCTASVISTDTKSTLWTAAHCVHKGDGSGDAGFYPYVAFLAGVDEGYTL